jgi:hypothetical protein
MKDAARATLALYQGTTLQIAEKFTWSCEKRQGMTLVVPIAQQKIRRALAPAGGSRGFQPPESSAINERLLGPGLILVVCSLSVNAIWQQLKIIRTPYAGYLRLFSKSGLTFMT